MRELGEGGGTRFEFGCYDIGHLYTFTDFAERGLGKAPFLIQGVLNLSRRVVAVENPSATITTSVPLPLDAANSISRPGAPCWEGTSAGVHGLDQRSFGLSTGNTLDLEPVRALAEEFRSLGSERGIVLTGTERVFSAGVDRQRLLTSDRAHTRTFWPT